MFSLNLKTPLNYSDKLSLLVFSSGLGAGGAEGMLLRLAKHFKTNKCQIFIINLTKEKTLEKQFTNMGVIVIPISISNPLEFLIKFFLLLRFFKGLNLKAIIGWMYLGCVVASIFKIFLHGNYNLYWSIRQSLSFWQSEKPTTRIVIHLARLLSTCPKKIIYNSNLAKYQHGEFGFSKKNASFIANGFDILSKEEIIANRATFRKEFGFKKGDIVVGMVGRFHPVKGHEIFVKMFQKTWPDRFPDNLKFILIGEGVPENLKARLPTFLLEQRRILIIGRRNDAAKIMSSFEALLVTSHAEAFPNVVGEAMAASIPVISTDVGDVRLILPSDRGLFTAGKLDELTSKIEGFCALSEDERLAWGEQNREIVRLRYNIEDVFLSYAKIFGIN